MSVKLVNNIKTVFKKMNVYPNVDQLKNDENLFSAGALDSLVLIQFVLALEDEFKIRFKNEDINYDKFQSFNLIEENITSYLQIKKSS